MFKLFTSRPDHRVAVLALHEAMVTVSRRPEFYQAGVPDTLDGRFELLLLHLFLLIHRLRLEKALSQQLFDHTFAILDLNVREMGVGDLGVGKRVKAMGRAFYGRAEAYSAGQEGNSLNDALSRNLFGTLPEAPPESKTAPFADYLRRQLAHLENQPTSSLLQGQVTFSEVLR